MREMEREHGGLFRGALARMRARKKAPVEDSPRPQFMTFEAGAQVLVDELTSQLRVQILIGCPAVSIQQQGQLYQVNLENGRQLLADAVILAAPANQSAKILAGLSPDSAELLKMIKHENIGTAALIYRAGQIDLPYKINGLMIPRREKRRIDAVTWTTNKPLNRAPKGYEMLRVFFGGSDPDLVNMSETQIIRTIRDELGDIFGIRAEPVQSQVFCWPESFPQAYVDHLDLVDRIESSLPPGIFVAGSSYRGIGVPDCVRQGQSAAEQAHNYLY
jgi:oxygen-dependent protoporphyrinogen oxidase